MRRGLTIRVVDPDPDYLGIEIHACNERFAGSTRIFARVDDLSTLADRINGFPEHSHDERIYEFGSRDVKVAGGYCNLRFYCADRAGHPVIEVALSDDVEYYAQASVSLHLLVEAAGLDQFVNGLRQIERECQGEISFR